ncbi:cytochrome c oxidase subunit 8A, mitochondrial [Brachionichthys hirsutus]|uniref:cytochrome c oxidase subunit 8A, mitochondrial n=1 Tax=Brachionichthys hirsutus TaxID=412623 RepID=UPI003604BB67
MPLLLRTVARRAAPVLRARAVCQRASIYTKPAKDTVGPLETVIGISVFAVAILGPSGWILSHLEDYKSRE